MHINIGRPYWAVFYYDYFWITASFFKPYGDKNRDNRHRGISSEYYRSLLMGGLLFIIREVCSLIGTIVICPEVQCISHSNAGCKLKKIYHSTDLFCTSYKNRIEPEYKQMVNNSKYVDHTKCGR